MLQTAEKEYRSCVTRIGFTMLLHFALCSLFLWRAEYIVYFFTGIELDETVAGLLNSAGYMLCFMLPVAFYKIISVKHETATLGLGVVTDTDTLLLIPGGIALILGLAYLNNFILSSVDFSSVYADTSINSPEALVVEFISTALVPAVCEEFLFRGCILRSLEPWGRQSAIFASAFLFAMMHGNVIQFLYTFCAGLVMGFVCVETGSVWPGMFMHLFNNFSSVIGTVLTANADSNFLYPVYYIIETCIFIGGFAALVAVIIRRNGRFLSNGSGERFPGVGNMKRFFCPAIIIYTVLSVADGLYILIYALISHE